MLRLSRRQILIFFAGTASAALLGDKILKNNSSSAADKINRFNFTPVRLPHPLPIYKQHDNYLPTGIGEGKVLNASGNLNLTSYNIVDDVVVPPEYEHYVIVSWGDRVFSNQEEYVGYNCDYTAFVAINKNKYEGYLWVNHEYVSYPISTSVLESAGDLAGIPTAFESVIGWALPDSINLQV